MFGGVFCCPPYLLALCLEVCSAALHTYWPYVWRCVLLPSIPTGLMFGGVFCCPPYLLALCLEVCSAALHTFWSSLMRCVYQLLCIEKSSSLVLSHLNSPPMLSLNPLPPPPLRPQRLCITHCVGDISGSLLTGSMTNRRCGVIHGVITVIT